MARAATKAKENRDESSRLVAAKRSGETSVENWAADEESEAYEEAAKLYTKIQRCYDNKADQSDSCDEYWAIFNALPDGNAQYGGNSTCYLPEVRNCINARTKRTLKQLFPASRRHVEAFGTEPERPYALMAMMEHYIRSTGLKNVVRADLIAGDVTGQWNVYVDWCKSYRSIKELVPSPAILEDQVTGEDIEDLDPEEEQQELRDTEKITEGPEVVCIATEDVAVYPPTAQSVEKAIAASVRLRMSKDKVRQLFDEGVFVLGNAHNTSPEQDQVDHLWGLGKSVDKGKERKNPSKQRTQDAGVKTEGTNEYALVYEVSCNLRLDGEGKGKVPALVYFLGPNLIAGIIRNPLWSGKRPLLSAGIEETTGSFWGRSKVEPVKYLQWNLNDYWNMGQDSAQYSLLPIVMTDPEATPNYQSMVYGLAAVWLADPNKTKFASFPALYKEAIPLCTAIQSQIRQSMDVNDAMMGISPAGRKNAQAVGAQQQDQQINITDHAERYEEMILSPLMELFFELDQQFRTEELLVLQRGEIGIRASMQSIKPNQFEQKYEFRWCGTEYVKGMQQVQQQISWMNVLRGMPPQLLNGRRLDITPILEAGTEIMFGPEVSPRILIDDRDLYQVDPEHENMMLHNGFAVEVHEADDDPQHIQAHIEAAKHTQDPTGHYRSHLALHFKQLQNKRQKQQAQAGPGAPGQPGQQGVPGGAGAGVPGSPRPGATPMPPKGGQQPPGAVHSDQMADPAAQGRG